MIAYPNPLRIHLEDFCNRVQQKKSILVFFVAAIIVFGFLYFSGTLTSGFHFIDDHEMLRIGAALKEKNVLEVLKEFVVKDFDIRFRPLYMIHRVVEVWALGTNFLSLSIYTGFLATLTFSLFFISARDMGFSVGEALLFVCVSFVGPQASIWWRLGPNETIGMVMLGIATFFLSRCFQNPNDKVSNLFFYIMLVISSLCKESILIIVPAFIVYKIFRERELLAIPWQQIIWRNIYAIPVVGLLIAELIIIFLFVGTNQIGYAGVDSNLLAILFGVWDIIRETLLLHLLVVGVFLGLALLRTKNKVDKIILPVVFSALIIGPNLILYAKSGMFGHYILPTSIGLGFLMASLLHVFQTRIFKIIGYEIAVFFVVFLMGVTFLYAGEFARNGAMTSEFLRSINENTQSQEVVLLVANPVKNYEMGISFSIYNHYLLNKKLYIYTTEFKSPSGFEQSLIDAWNAYFHSQSFKDLEGAPQVIAFFNRSDVELFFSGNPIDLTSYSEISNSSSDYVVFRSRH